MSHTPQPYFDPEAKEAAQATKEAVDSGASAVQDAVDQAKNAVDDKVNDSSEPKKTCRAIIDTLSQEADKVKACATSAAKKVASEAERAADSAKDLAKKTADNLNEEFKDPAVSTTVLFTVLTASAASTYLSQQHKQGALTPLAASVVVLGTAAIAFAEYWGVKAYFDRKSK